MAENASMFDLQEISIFLGEMIRNAFRNGVKNGFTMVIQWFYNGYITVIQWLYNGSIMVI